MVRNKKLVLVLGAGLCLAAALLSLWLGAAGLGFSQVLGALVRGPDGSLAGRIVWYARLPRTAATLLSGAALAVSGCVIQGVLSNQLASPSIIGVNAGAGLAVTACCALGAASGWAYAGAAFLGAVASALLVLFAAQKAGASRTTVILGGVAVNSILNALSEALSTVFPDAAMLSRDFRVGGFASVSYTRLFPAGVLILLGLLLLLTLCSELDILALGSETAQSLGLAVSKFRILFLILAALLAGAAVSFAGLLGFVGLIVPHAARKLVGGECRRLLPLCALGGAGFVTLCDLAARLAFSPYELPVGILLALLGGPAFLFLLLKRKGGRGDA